MKSEKPLSEKTIGEIISGELKVDENSVRLVYKVGFMTSKRFYTEEDIKNWVIAIVKDCKKETLHPITGNWTNCGQGIRCERCLDFMEKFELKESDLV